MGSTWRCWSKRERGFGQTLTKSGFIIASACKNHQRAKWAILGLFVVAVTSGLLMKMDLWSYFVMAVVIAVSIAIGNWLGPRDAEERTTLAIESAARHPGLAMTIAALHFNPQKALPVLIPYLIVFMVVTTVYLPTGCATSLLSEVELA